MTDAFARDDVPPPRSPLHRAVLVLAVLRYAIPIAALPLIPALQADNVALLLLLRPGKEILLLAGFRASQGSVSVLTAFVAFLPLGVMAVWVFFALGRLEGPRLLSDPPRWLARSVPPDVLRAGQRVLRRRGVGIAAAGRIAALPPTVLAAAAGSSEIRPLRYLASDFAGAVAAYALTVGIGWVLGDTYERAGPWLTGLGVLVLLALYRLAARWVEAELDAQELDPAHIAEEDLRHLGE